MNKSRMANKETLYYIFKFIYGLSFAWLPVLVIFLSTSASLDLTQIMFVESLFAIVILLMEIPTGIFADRFGKRLSLILGCFCQCIGFLILAFCRDLPTALLSQIFLGLGAALNSGTFSALVFQNSPYCSDNKEFKRIMGKSNAMMYLGLIPSVSLSGSLASINIIYPFILSAACCFLLCLVALQFQCSESSKIEKAEMPSKKKFVELFRSLGKIPILPCFVAVSVAIKFGIHTINPYFEQNGIPLSSFGPAYAGFMIVAALLNFKSHFVLRGDVNRRFWLILCLLATAFLLMSREPGSLLALSLPALFFISQSFVQILMDATIHQAITDANRTTALSVVSFYAEAATAVCLPY